MKFFYALLLTMFFAQNSYSQSKLFDIGGFVKEKIQEGSRTVIGKIIEDRGVIDDKKNICVESETLKSANDSLSSVVNAFGGNPSFSTHKPFLIPNSACQDWVKIEPWSFVKNDTNDATESANTTTQETLEQFKLMGGTKEQIELIKKSLSSKQSKNNNVINSINMKSNLMFNSNSSCIFMHNISNNAGANCSGYIDLKSIKKGFMGIDYVFYSMWDYEKPVEVAANETTFYVIKVDKDNPLMVKSLRNVVGVNCSSKKYIVVGWLANTEPMGYGIRVSDGNYIASGGPIEMRVNLDFGKTLDRMDIQKTEPLERMYDNFSKNDEKSRSVIDVICSGKTTEELRVDLGKLVNPDNKPVAQVIPVTATLPIAVNNNLSQTAAVALPIQGMFADGDVLSPKIPGVKVFQRALNTSKVITTLKKDDQVVFLGQEEKDFLKVQGADGEGWVDKKLVKK